MTNHVKRIPILLCAVLLLTLLAPTLALAKAEGMLSADLDGFFGWFYCTRNIPQGASLRDQTLQISSMYHAAGQPEGLISCAVEFVRGDEHLRDAVKVACTRSNSIDYSTLAELTTVTAEISIDNNLLSELGTAVFAFTFETEHYALRKTETFGKVMQPEGEVSFTLPAELKGTAAGVVGADGSVTPVPESDGTLKLDFGSTQVIVLKGN